MTGVWGVVLHYDSAEATAACVAALRRSRHPLSVIVVENGPGGAGFGADITLATGRNLGYGGGVNVGLRFALARGAQWLWVVTPDVRVEPETLEALLAAGPARPYGLRGPLLRAGRRLVTRSGHRPALGYLTYHRFGEPPAAPVESDFVDGGCLLLHRAVLEEVGLFREDFFLYYEDVELCLRARERGFRSCLVPGARAHTRCLREPRADRTFYLVRNSLYLARLKGRFLRRTVARNLVQYAGCGSGLWRGLRHGLGDPLR